MWKTVKSQTGQSTHKVPQLIREGKLYTPNQETKQIPLTDNISTLSEIP